MNFRLKYVALMAVSVVTFLVGYGVIAHAAVTWPIYSRNSSYGYFLNVHDNDGTNVFPTNSDTPGCAAASGDAIPAWVNTASDFIGFIECKLNSTNTSSSYKKQEKVGAAFIIQTMLGKGSTTNPPTAAQITDWEAQVNYAAAHGLISWTYTYSYEYNSFYQGVYTDSNPVDDAFYADSDSASSIVFKNAAGTILYAIRRQCANPVGKTPAKPVDYNWTLTGTTNTNPTTVTSVNAGQNITWTNSIHNAGPEAASFTWYTRYCWDTCQGVYTSYTQQNTGSQTALASNGNFAPPDWIAATSAAHTKLCMWITFTNATGVNTAAKNSTMKCVTIIAATPSCGTMTITPSPVGPSDPYTIHSSVQVTGGQAQANTVVASGAKYFVHISGPGAPANNDNVTPMTTGTSGTYGTISTDYALGAMNNAGTYSVTWGITGGTAINCGPQTFDIAYSPYFSVKGGDIMAGTGFGDGSCSEGTADIQAWNNNTSKAPNYAGAGSELAALATGDITNFATGMGLGGGVAAQFGHGLSFANMSNGETNSPPNYGGGFGTGSLPCVPDYYSGANGTVIPSTTTTFTFPSGAGTFNYNANDTQTAGYVLTLGTGSPVTIPSGQTLNLYVYGDVYIKNDIKYAGYTLGQVPRFNLYVDGNIYIDHAVTELHGVYIAQDDGSGDGNIDTCVGYSGGVVTTQSYANCKNALTFYGAVAAEGQLQLLRTYGNLTAVGGSSTPAAPAETFQYSPELWLNSLGASGQGVQAYTSLPPVL